MRGHAVIKMQNLHTHTTYVDGLLSPEEMILAAIESGCDSLGFSEHSYVPYDEHFSMPPDATQRYIEELKELRVKYKDKIEIFIGLEMDFDTPWRPKEVLDYTLGSAHNLKIESECGDEKYVSIDASAEFQKHIAETYFAGDYYGMAEAYFEMMTSIVEKTNADIIGHFDLITKFNNNYSRFDERHPRYLNAALNAMDKILKRCRIFEVNTGAMYRCGKTEPYPSIYLLKELKKRGGEVIITSDCHDGKSICYAFDEMSELLKSCGFTHQKRLTENGFIDVEL